MKCENCNSEHLGEYGSGRFCNIKCARGFSTKNKRTLINNKVSKKLKGNTNSKGYKHTDSSKEMISKSLKATYLNLPELSEAISKRMKGRIGEVVFKKCKYCDKKKYISFFSSICEDCQEPFKVYRRKCRFKFDVYDYPNLFDISLIDKHGWYSPSNSKNPNINGISKDHLYSVSEGFKNGIDPKIISHPLNCKLVLQKHNARKNSKCDISLKELISKIDNMVKW